MKKIQRIVNLIEDLQDGVFKKHESESVQRVKAEEKFNKSKTVKDCESAMIWVGIHEHTKGQLYELNYLLEEIWGIISSED
jgi:isochorismate hydrolase